MNIILFIIMFALFIIILNSMKYPSTHFTFFIDPLIMAILDILSTIGSLQLQCFRRYSEMSSDKRGVVNLGHFALDKAFGTYHMLFLGVKLA